ncbi:Uma2 family endonuclease [Polyangium sorediatum]|uniref:Uma2 family endonuclease n=1 Tax=Polyangium sorediatum TaxID=889274 RepID=A0ABT6NVQ0_9BACT|nr:Uma2 family endonuclease [Polyangium sorediatum]MDI1432376.1 Uma2 family endonuclease [Polyangium sorediatum]
MSSAARERTPATYADLEALPPGVKGEVIEGVLYTQPRPRGGHAIASSILGRRIGDPFGDGIGGPGGWWILDEPGIELPGSPEVAPDIAGWRRERMPEVPDDGPITVVPDWVCEVLSPSNRTYDRRIKFPYYAKVGVAYLWVVDPPARTVEIKKLINGHFSDIAVFADDEFLRAEPFDAVEIPLSPLWFRGP